MDRELLSASVRVEAHSAASPVVNLGSGTVIAVEADRALVLTCAHTFRGVQAPQIVVTLTNQKRFAGTLLGIDYQADLAAIAITADSAIAWVPVADSPARRGEAVWQVGYPHGRGPVPRSGTCYGAVGAVGPNHSVVSIRSTMHTESGDSGGGLFRQADQTLIGVIWGEGSHAIGVEYIHPFVDQTCLRWFPRWRQRRPPQARQPRPPVGPGPTTPPPLPPPGGPVAGTSGPPGAPGPPGPAGRDAELTPVLAAMKQLQTQLESLTAIVGRQQQQEITMLGNRPPQATDLGPILAEVKRLDVQMAQLRVATAQPGPAGPAGRDGERGPAGPAGSAGVDGDVAGLKLEVEKLRKEMADFMGSLRVRVVPVK